MCGQLLIYPVTDYHTPGTPSYRENAEGYGLTRDTMVWFWNHYLSDPADAAHPCASPLRARDFSGLPPALVVTAEYDPLRDEGEYYAEKLRAAGTPAATSRWPGMNHGFFFWVGLVDKAGVAMDEVLRLAAWDISAEIRLEGFQLRGPGSPDMNGRLGHRSRMSGAAAPTGYAGC